MKATISKRFRLNFKDFSKAFLMAIIIPVLEIIQRSLSVGEWTFNFKTIGIAALSGFVGYLLKNFLEPTKTIVKGDHVEEFKGL